MLDAAVAAMVGTARAAPYVGGTASPECRARRLLLERGFECFEEDLGGLADAVERDALAVAVHRGDGVTRQDRGEDAVALHALRAEGVRVGSVRDQHRRDDGLG